MLLIFNCSNEPCDANCEKVFFTWFRKLNVCPELCSSPSDAEFTVIIPSEKLWEKGQQVKLTPADCGRCYTAKKSWEAGSECTTNEQRCVLPNLAVYSDPILQKCVDINGRMTWPDGRECNASDQYPCVSINGGAICWGCKTDNDCNGLQRNQFADKIYCDTQKQQCTECTSDQECKSNRICEEGKCLGCSDDSDCSPEFTGTLCDDRFRCTCASDEDCHRVGYLECGSSGQCRRCQQNTDCQNMFDEQSRCIQSRCLSPCQTDEDCAHYSSASCSGDFCVIWLNSCQSNSDCKQFGITAQCIEQKCINKTSSSSCTKHSDCVRYGLQARCNGGVCRRSTGGCKTDSDCINDTHRLICQDGQCKAAEPMRCKTKDDCEKLGPNFRCVIGQCRLIILCRSDAECMKYNRSLRCKLGHCVNIE